MGIFDDDKDIWSGSQDPREILELMKRRENLKGETYDYFAHHERRTKDKSDRRDGEVDEVESFEAGPKEDARPRIPGGEYTAKCIRSDIKDYQGKGEKIYLHFRITEGEWRGTELFRAYNYYKKFPTGSDYYTDWSIANGGLPKRNDRMSTKVFKGKPFQIKVRDSKPRYPDGTTKQEMFFYSVVDRIIRCIE